MAITRCPYCHAIIDENDKYCNNCGTQLLFPEDEEIEEEIPGEKIIDAETEEKDYEIGLEDLIEEETVKAAGLDESEVSEKDEEREEREEEESRDVIVLDEAELKEDIEESFLMAAPGARETGPEQKEPAEEEPEPKPDEETRELRIVEADAEGPSEAPSEPPTGQEPMEETPPAAGPVPPTFDTVELEGMGKTVELGKDRIDGLLEAISERKTDEEPPRKETREPTGTLPPWANVMKGAPAFSDVKDTDELDGTKVEKEKGPWQVEEQEIFPRKKRSDSTIGFPERVTQAALPFAAAAEEEVREEDEGPAVEEAVVEEVAEAEEEESRGFLKARRREVPPPGEPDREFAEDAEAAEEEAEPDAFLPFNVSAFLKSKAFDVLFVGLFWLVALWLAAGAMGVSLFGILAAMSGSMLLLYAVFVLIYFFFFKFFLGETLGERLFRGRP